MRQISYFKFPSHKEKYLRVINNNLKLKSNTCLLCLVFLLAVLQSCSKMNDLHQPYLDEGEIVYAEKVDTVEVRPGNKRIKLDMHINTESIKTTRIYWNNYTDSVDVDIANQRGVFDRIIEDLNEQQYVFQFVNFDSYGNKSLPYEVLGQVYGDDFQSLTSNRAISGDVLLVESSSELIINWSLDVTNVAFCELMYTNINDVEVTQIVPAAENVTVLPGFKSDLTYFTASKPDLTAIDLFFSETISVGKILLDYNEWEIEAFSTEHTGSDNTVANFIDGNQETRWHSLAGGSSYPHWVIIDLQQEVYFSAVEIFRTTFQNGGDNRAPDKIQLEVSKDNATWTDFGIFDFDRNSNDGQIYPVDLLEEVRYLRFTATEGPEDNLVLGKIQLIK
ncbi:DUF4998 domain-containing protein [Flavivirga aquimarina]|uniref:DUF4998 domain-containing protein n=1 Tax=Flavivirga aquimarina TaxID=2027862 RepID=A0ABT8W9V8_9FLAO|nr:DUF4998 domain-containing protein [Flavivirga aquimarina]MDO5969851.1 DUF4998 domain-containing protein [Flavivirga aquimarina]